MEQMEIEVHLNEEFPDGTVCSDPVIIATGAVRAPRKCSGYERMIEACDYLNGAEVGRDGSRHRRRTDRMGRSPTELALQGKKPVIVEMKDDLIAQKGVCLAQQLLPEGMVRPHKIPVYLETTLKEVGEKAIVCRGKDGTETEIPRFRSSAPSDIFPIRCGRKEERLSDRGLRQSRKFTDRHLERVRGGHENQVGGVMDV